MRVFIDRQRSKCSSALTKILILGSEPIAHRALKGRAFKARRKGNKRIAALAAEVPS